MNDIFQLHRDKQLFRLTDGAEHHFREEGLFEVRDSLEQVSRFTTLVGAFLFYLRLDTPSTLWDVTEECILIERTLVLVAPRNGSN